VQAPAPAANPQQGNRVNSDSREDPRSAYTARRARHAAEGTRLARQFDRLANTRVALFAGLLLAPLAAPALGLPVALLAAVPGLGFVAAIIAHERCRRALAASRAASRLYEDGLARLDGKWQGTGDQGADLAPKAHLYAADLDLFGPGSLFQFLSAARTAAGRHQLAAWIGGPAPVSELRARQAAVAELRARLDLREELARVGEAVAAQVHPEALAAWARRPVHPRLPLLRRAALVIAAANASLVAVALWWGMLWPLLAALLSAMLAFAVSSRWMQEEMAALSEPAREWPALAAALACFERESFDSPLLRSLQDGLRAPDASASQALREIDRITWRLDQMRNPMLAIPLGVVLWGVLGTLAIQGWRARHGAQLAAWLDALGGLEALVSLARFAFEHPAYPFPELVDGDARVQAEGLGHPLIPAATRVCNDVSLGPDCALLLVSGSNMSGKSTFLRSIGVNVALALAGAPVCAARLTLTPLRVGATMHVQDSVQEGASRFYAELQRIKRLVDAPPDPPVLFLLDELLHGTNSHDRRAGAEALLARLLRRGGLGLASTHDLALTRLTATLPAPARNVHFVDQFADGRLCFDYRLREGVVEHSNALQLMASLGLISAGDPPAPGPDSAVSAARS
jgi:hypothetical protein